MSCRILTIAVAIGLAAMGRGATCAADDPVSPNPPARKDAQDGSAAEKGDKPPARREAKDEKKKGLFESLGDDILDLLGRKNTKGISAGRKKFGAPEEPERPGDVAKPERKVKPDDEPEAGAGKNPLDSAIEGMRAAQNQIADKETGKSTREIQEQVIKDLEKLIEQAKNPPKSPQSPNSSSQSQNSKSQNRQNSSSSKSSRNQQQAKNGADQAEGQRTEADKAKESSDETRAAREREAELARRRDLIKDVWGHLPPALRQKLLNVASEKSLPKYDELVRRYFESLAEEGTQSGSTGVRKP